MRLSQLPGTTGSLFFLRYNSDSTVEANKVDHSLLGDLHFLRIFRMFQLQSSFSFVIVVK